MDPQWKVVWAVESHLKKCVSDCLQNWPTFESPNNTLNGNEKYVYSWAGTCGISNANLSNQHWRPWTFKFNVKSVQRWWCKEKQSKPRGCRYKCSKSIEIIGERNLRSWRTSLLHADFSQAEASIIVDLFVRSNIMNARKVHTFRQVKNTHNNRTTTNECIPPFLYPMQWLSVLQATMLTDAKNYQYRAVRLGVQRVSSNFDPIPTNRTTSIGIGMRWDSRLGLLMPLIQYIDV